MNLKPAQPMRDPKTFMRLLTRIRAKKAAKACIFVLEDAFWERPLKQLDRDQWEALCDGCGVCCLIKFVDDETQKDIEYTSVGCKLLDTTLGQCMHYPTRSDYVPDCISLTVDMLPKMWWLPDTCAYKRRYLGQDLPAWHYLVCEDDEAAARGLMRASAAGRIQSEAHLGDDEIEAQVVKWVKVTPF